MTLLLLAALVLANALLPPATDPRDELKPWAWEHL